MRTVMFICDLDNTLIHSKKHRADGDICIEWLDGEELSFAGAEVHALLDEVRKSCVFIPITTRSEAQYRRITLFDAGQLAVCDHGAKLLLGGSADRAWQAESEPLIRAAQRQLDNALEVMAAMPLLDKVRMVDGAFAFAVCVEPAKTAEQCAVIRSHVDETLVDVLWGGRKLYVFPRGIDKGNAAERLRRNAAVIGEIGALWQKSDIFAPMLGKRSGYCPEHVVSQEKPRILPPEMLIASGTETRLEHNPQHVITPQRGKLGEAQMSAAIVIAAGDSVFDVPMLQKADFALIPESAALDVKAERLSDDGFTEAMLRRVLEIIRE